MKSSIIHKLESIVTHIGEVSASLSDPEVISDQNRFRELSKEYAKLEPVVACFKQYQEAVASIENAKSLLKDSDPDMRAMAEDELSEAQNQRDEFEKQLQILLLPEDPNDERNVYLEIRAGTGGDEAALFAGDLFRMYSRFAERKGWQVEIITTHEGDHGGFKETITKIIGQGAYSQLKFESGAHRVQRVPETESQGRIHTSACTVAVMPEVEEIDEVELKTEDLKIDTYRASGAGGQHVNVTDSAVRITHIPTGVVAECQDERSQHKNKAKAMSLLQSRILMAEQEKQQKEQAATRKSLVGSGDRSERIRTYNFPQGRMTDHRINLTLYKLESILDGDLEQVIGPLISEHQAELLSAVGE